MTRELMIAVEGISAPLVAYVARRVGDVLTTDGPRFTMVETVWPDSGEPLRHRTASVLAMIARPRAAGRRIVLSGYVGTMLAYRAAHGDDITADLAVIEQWSAAGAIPDLTLLVDIAPEVAVRHGALTGPMELHEQARDGLLRAAGHDRQGWRVIPGAARAEVLQGAVDREVRWLLHTRVQRWPLEHGWRGLAETGV